MDMGNPTKGSSHAKRLPIPKTMAAVLMPGSGRARPAFGVGGSASKGELGARVPAGLAAPQPAQKRSGSANDLPQIGQNSVWLTI